MLFSAAIDTAIGLLMVYLTLSLICTSINEAIAGLLRLRARNLFNEVSRALNDTKLRNAFWQSSLIHSLSRSRVQDVKNKSAVKAGEAPSYLDRRDFARALIAALRSIDGSKTDGNQPLNFAALTEKIDENSLLAHLLTALGIDATFTIEQTRKALGDWFDQVMERASGVYKRWMSLLSFGVALALTVAMNADTLQIARTFWQDDGLRAAVVESAVRLPKSSSDVSPALPDLAQVKDFLPLPLGWSMPALFGESLNVLLPKGLGLLLTAFAVTLGAPFWFDLLSRFVAIRNSGQPQSKKSPDD
ncbi:hypothetical protein [Rhizobium sp. SAFR-030]|uniref:hypothetical protein n=1 Tax=Rhizobium sp. SAFR-030 TaxID=3387277 RepID=UPI003F8215D1